MYLIKRDECPTCSEKEYKEIYSLPFRSFKMQKFLKNYYKDTLELDKFNDYDFKLLECQNCNLIFQEQIPSNEFSSELYENIIDKDISISKKNDYEKKFSKKLKYEIQLIQNLFKKDPKDVSILEFGAGWGNWSLVMKNNYFQVVAYEISNSRINYMKKNNITNIDNLNELKNKFDLIYSEETFEHIPNPKQTLMKLSSLLNDNGYILLRFPSSFLFKLKLTEDYCPTNDCAHPLEHINLFRLNSFKKMLKGTNLKIIIFKSKYNFSLINFLKDIKNFIYFDSILIKKI